MNDEYSENAQVFYNGKPLGEAKNIKLTFDEIPIDMKTDIEEINNIPTNIEYSITFKLGWLGRWRIKRICRKWAKQERKRQKQIIKNIEQRMN